MDSLLRVMAAKKRELSVIQAEKANKKEKYLRRADVDDLLYTQESAAQTQLSKKRKLEQSDNESNENATATTASTAAETTTSNSTSNTTQHGEQEEETAMLSSVEMKRRLRELGQPIALFGETKRERMERLRRAEHDAASRREDELGEGHDIRNEFVGHRVDDGGARDRADAVDDEDDDDTRAPSDERLRGRGEEDGAASTGDTLDGGDAMDGKERDDVVLIYRFFKGMLRRWEQDLADRPDHIKRTAQGKIATKTMKQCKDYIRPLFKLCKKRDVPSDILPSLAEIVRFCQQGEFVQANDAYIKLAIGNAAWPIGVTMVGIHERTGREKINANKQAHVMNNENQRKYITSVKRLVSYAQSVSSVLPSKKVP